MASLSLENSLPERHRLTLRLREHMQGLGDDDYLEAAIAYHAAPTLRRWKIATLLASGRSAPPLAASWRRNGAAWRRRFGVDIVNLREAYGTLLLLIHHADLLAEHLARPAARGLLRRAGYPVDGGGDGGGGTALAGLLGELAARSAPGEPFPHEIGLFLGYPPRDVAGFMFCGGAECRAADGAWKVYGDPTESRRCEARYRYAKRLAARRLLVNYAT